MMRALFMALMLCVLISAPASAKILDIRTVTTPKGITVWLVEDHTLPVMALSFAFHGGAAGDSVDKQGASQLLSNTLDEGAGDMDAEAFQTALRDRAIDLGFDSGRDAFSGTLRTLIRHKDEAVRLLKLAVNQPRFDAEPVERMKQANLTRIRSAMNDSAWIGARILNDRMYDGHPYALNSGGTLQSMAALTPADLRATYKRLFNRSNLVVGIAGDIDETEAARIVDDVFGALPDKAEDRASEPAAFKPGKDPVFFARKMPQTDLSMAWPGIDEHDPDYYAAIVFDYIYGGGGFSSLLMNEVREKRGLTYGISSSMITMDDADRFMVLGSMLPQNVQPTIDVILDVARGIRENGVGDDALQAAKDYLTGSLPLRFSSTASIAGAMVSLQLNDRPVTALDDWRAKIMAVTSKDVQRVAGRIFAADPVITLVGTAPDGMTVETLDIIPNAETSVAP